MSYAIQEEQADELRYKKAQEALAYFQEKEAEARRELARCMDSVKIAREKMNAVFQENENRACQRRKDGRIVVSSCYGD